MDLHRSVLFWCFFFFLLVVPETTLAAGPYLGAAYLTCMHNTTNGTSLTSTFKHNLNTALQNLTSLSSKGTKYAITTAGSGDQDMVYAMFQCRGDQTTQLCSECVANATVRLPERECPASIGARIQLDGCYLGYDNKSFFTLDVSYAISYCYRNSSDSAVLATIRSLVQNVTTQAPEQGGFAWGSAVGVYAAAQCLGYLNKSECSQCLSSVPYNRTVCNSTLGELQVQYLTSCYYRFEPYSFLEAPPSPAPAPAPPAPAPPAPAPAPNATATAPNATAPPAPAPAPPPSPAPAPAPATPAPAPAPAPPAPAPAPNATATATAPPNATATAPPNASASVPLPSGNDIHTGSKTPIIAAGIIALIIALCVMLVWRNKAKKKRRGGKWSELATIAHAD